LSLPSVLFVTIEFAPVNTTGNFRSLKFAKYLPLYGLQPVIFTLDIAEASAIFNATIDTNLLAELPADTPIYRTKLSPVADWKKTKIGTKINFLTRLGEGIADRWQNAAFWKQLDFIVAEHQPKVIYVSCPPFSCARVGANIADRYKIPFVLDMRDAWVEWGTHMTYLHYLRVLGAENYVFQRAAAVLTVTDELKNRFIKNHKNVNPQKFHCVTNGYDAAMLTADTTQNKLPKPVVAALEADKIFKIGYVGAFYYDPNEQTSREKKWWQRRGTSMLHYYPVKENWLYRTPYFFLKTLKLVFEIQPEYRKNIQFELIGRIPEWLPTMVAELGLQDNVKYHGFVPQAQAIAIQYSFDMLLATSEKIADDVHYCLPSKLFDYIVVNKPILAFVTEGSQKCFLENLGTAVLCNPDDIAQAATQFMACLQNGFEGNIQQDFIAQYERKETTRALADILKKVSV
jgi:glycosyltransferase involved in cell wall biosynthesis